MTLLRTWEYVSDMLDFPSLITMAPGTSPKTWPHRFHSESNFWSACHLSRTAGWNTIVMMYTLQPHSSIPFPHSIWPLMCRAYQPRCRELCSKHFARRVSSVKIAAGGAIDRIEFRYEARFCSAVVRGSMDATFCVLQHEWIRSITLRISNIAMICKTPISGTNQFLLIGISSDNVVPNEIW